MNVPFTSLPSCFHDYEVVQRKGSRLLMIRHNDKTSVIKLFPLNVSGVRQNFAQEKSAFRRLEGLGITPQLINYGICDNIGYIQMESYQYTLGKMLHKLTPNQKRTIVDSVTSQIDRMHNSNIGHGDLHIDNIVLNIDNDKIETAIIDFEHSYDIDTGENDSRAIQWRNDGFDWNQSYDDFIQHDYENWRSEM